MLPSRGGRKAIISQIGLSLLLLCTQIAAQDLTPASSQQTQNAPDCVGEWNLKMDPNGDNPCQGVIDAMTACAGTYTLPDINVQPFGLYPVPSPSANTTTCECNEVAYNLFQACTACQLGANTTLSRRSAWFAYCPSVQTEPIQPLGFTETTFWATQVYNPIFDVSVALEVARTHQPPPSQSVDSSSVVAETASPSAFSASSSMPKQSHTGAIIGAVVGGVALLSVITFCIIFYVRRKQSHTAPSKEFMQYAPVNQAIIPPHDEESGSFHNQNLRNSQQQLVGGPNRNSAAMRQDSGVTEEMETLPGFTPGLFKDPIFEKGAALNIASHAGYPTGVAGGASASPVTYSPATPSTTYHTNEGQRLIQSRQASGS